MHIISTNYSNKWIWGIVYVICSYSEVFGVVYGGITRIETNGIPSPFPGNNVIVKNVTSPCQVPIEISVDRKTGVVYVACDNAGVIGISIDDTSPILGESIVTIIANSTQCSMASSVSVNSNTGIVYFICSGNSVSSTRTLPSVGGNFTIVATVNSSQCSSLNRLSVDSNTGIIYASCFGSVFSIGTSPDKTTTTVIGTDQCSAPYGISIDTSRSIVYAVCLNIGIIAAASNFNCPPGYYWTNTGCLLCPLGSFRNNTVSLPAKCSICPTGSVALSLGTVSCKMCSPGKYFIEARCDLCIAGKYQPKGGQSICEPCLPGTSQNQPGSASCSNCSTSSFARGEGNSICSTCPDGSVVNRNRTDCISKASCEPGYGFDDIFVACAICSVGTCNNGGISCQLALPTTYAPLPGCSVPLVCPRNPGVNCFNGSAYASEGYWLYTSNFVTGEIKVLPCLPGACVGGTAYGNQCDPTRLQSPSNIMCGSCITGYSPWGGKCYPCQSPNGGLITLIIGYSILFVGIIHLLSQSESSVNLSTFFYFVQVGLIICGGSISTFVSWLNVFNFRPQDAVGSCVLPLNPYSALATDIVVPFLYFAELLLILVTHLGFNYCLRFIERYRSKKHNLPSLPEKIPSFDRFKALFTFDKERYIRTFMALYLAGFSTIVTLTLRLLYCIPVGNESVLYWNPAVSCDDLTYKQLLVLVVFLLVVVLCFIPIATGLYLYYNRHRLNNDADNKIFFHRWGLLHEPFTTKAFYYSIFILGRRLLVGIFATVLAIRPTDEYMCFVLLHAILCIVHNHIKPYKEAKFNNVEEGSLLLLTLLSCVLLAYPSPFTSKGIIAVITILYLIPSILLMFDIATSYFRNLMACIGRRQAARIREMDQKEQEFAPENAVELEALPNVDLTSPISREETAVSNIQSTGLHLHLSPAMGPEVSPPIPGQGTSVPDVQSTELYLRLSPGMDLETSSPIPEQETSTSNVQRAHPHLHLKPEMISETCAPSSPSSEQETLISNTQSVPPSVIPEVFSNTHPSSPISEQETLIPKIQSMHSHLRLNPLLHSRINPLITPLAALELNPEEAERKKWASNMMKTLGARDLTFS